MAMRRAISAAAAAALVPDGASVMIGGFMIERPGAAGRAA